MKLKIMKREDDIILDYFRIGNMHTVRQDVLEHVVLGYDGSVDLYVDTNSKTKTMAISSIENCLKGCEVEYKIEAIESTRRGILGFKSLINTSKKNSKLPEHCIVAKLTKETPTKDLYNGFLVNYDYALGLGSDMEIGELSLRLMTDTMNVLFSKAIFKNTIYDSIVARRVRMDSPYELIESFANTKGPSY